MSKSHFLVCVLIIMCSGAQSSYPATYVVDVYDVELGVSPAGVFNFVDLNAEIVGITGVSIRVVGTGGGGTFDCTDVNPGGWYDMDVKFAFGNGRFGFSTTNQVEFDLIASELSSEPDPWSVCEGITRCPLPFTAYAQGAQSGDCIATDFVLPVISHVEITITAESVVSVTQVPWGTIKATYVGRQ